MSNWTAGRGDGHTIKILIRNTVRGFRNGFTSVMLDADTNEHIGSSVQSRDFATAKEDGQKLAETWWPGAKIVWG